MALKSGADIKKVFESDAVLAFHHTKPAYETHIVVIPKKHIWDARTVEDASVFSEILTVCRDILKTFLQAELDQKGARIITNIGKFQDTPHLHFHVVIGDKLK